MTLTFDKSVKIENDIGIMGNAIEYINYIKKQDGSPIHVKLASFKQNSSLIDVFDWIANVLQLL